MYTIGATMHIYVQCCCLTVIRHVLHVTGHMIPFDMATRQHISKPLQHRYSRFKTMSKVPYYNVSSKLNVSVIQDDIINVKADAVVTGEGSDLKRESFVTKALQHVSPSFKDIRRDLRREFRKVDLWTVQASALGIPFHYVIHAFLNAKRNDDWLQNMKVLYRRIFSKAESLPIRAVAVPLLGAGAADTDTLLSIQALVESISKLSPKYITEIKIVNMDPVIIDKILTQFEDFQKKGVASKICSRLGEIKYHVGNFLLGPDKRNDRNRQVFLEEKRQLDKAIKLSLEEHEKNKRERSHNAAHRNTSQTTWYPVTSSPQSVSYPSTNDAGRNSFVTFASRERSQDMDFFDEDDTVANDTWNENSISKSFNNGLSMTDYNGHSSRTETDMDLTCPICLSPIMVPKQLDKCGHIFCEDCIERCFRDFKPVCPSCNMVYGVITGNQPDGTMDVGFSSQSLPGYSGCGTITITYNIPSGTQQEDHPSPGQPFTGTTRRAYLPDCQEGKAILTLLKIAFDRKLTFTIGRSTTTGRDGVVTWNDIHHKTNMEGGPTSYGYPDPTYLSRVREELATKGVTDAKL